MSKILIHNPSEEEFSYFFSKTAFSLFAKTSSLQPHIVAIAAPGPATIIYPANTPTVLPHPALSFPAFFKSLKLSIVQTTPALNAAI
jgi:hypothetical protein